MKTLSIVIVNWNHWPLLFDLLTSLFKYAPQRDFEVIVIDNASTDRSREMVTAEFPSVKLLVNPSNLGFARAVNRGIRESCGQYVLLLNTDLIVLDGAIDAQITFMEMNPNCAICGGLLVNSQGEPEYVYGRFPSARILLDEVLPDRMGGRNRIGTVPPVDQSHAMPVDFVSGADLMARRAFFESVGLLDEQFFMYFEDADWCYRARQLGWEIYCVPSVRYTHIGSASSLGWSSIRPQWIASLGLFLCKHYRGAQFVTCWLLWQLLRAKFVWRMIRMRVQPRLTYKTES